MLYTILQIDAHLKVHCTQLCQSSLTGFPFEGAINWIIVCVS